MASPGENAAWGKTGIVSSKTPDRYPRVSAAVETGRCSRGARGATVSSYDGFEAEIKEVGGSRSLTATSPKRRRELRQSGQNGPTQAQTNLLVCVKNDEK